MTDNRIENLTNRAEELTSLLGSMETIWLGLPPQPQENRTEMNQLFTLLGVCIEKSRALEEAMGELDR